VTLLAPRARQLVRLLTFAVAVLAGTAFALMAVPSFGRFLPEAPPEFWVFLLGALLIEIFPLVLPHADYQPTRLAVSLSLTFAIFLLWGPAIAIVVQALALGVAQLRVPRPLTDFASNLVRFTLAFQVAGWVNHRVSHDPEAVGMDIRQFGLWIILVSAFAWYVTNFGVIGLFLVAAGSDAAGYGWLPRSFTTWRQRHPCSCSALS